MNLYYLFNSHHEIFLNKYFIPSFNKYVKNINLIGNTFDKSRSHCLFNTPEYKYLLTERVEYLIKLIDGKEKDNYFIFSDVDIQFFDNIFDTIQTYINDKYDIVFQLETANPFAVNCGFMLINGNQQTLNFWKTIHKILTSPNSSPYTNDQLEVNKLLYMINYSTFNKMIWNWSQGELNKQILLHHANCVSDIDKKIEQLEYVKNYINETL